MLGRFTTYPSILFATFLGTREHTVDTRQAASAAVAGMPADAGPLLSKRLKSTGIVI